MPQVTLSNFLYPPTQRPSTDQEIRSSGLQNPEEEILVAFDEILFDPWPCIPDWFCASQQQPHEQNDHTHIPHLQTGNVNTQPTTSPPMSHTGGDHERRTPDHFTTETWKLFGYPTDREKLALGQKVRFERRPTIRTGYLRSILTLEKFWVTIYIELKATRHTKPPKRLIVVLYAPICVVALPSLEKCIHRITFNLRRTHGEEVDWPTKETHNPPPTLDAATRVDLQVPPPVHKKPSVTFSNEVQFRMIGYDPALSLKSNHPVSIERTDYRLQEKSVWEDSD
ncbi:hypothetical protein BKA70DRAFT_1221827 [Coprinopsis sp. MPI-PUGE-AT-0042]|nr:hypothetical protein BKA70DRAFT_1221827 [Coprinopsis sp. MPI-PUGE-AT-0042]